MTRESINNATILFLILLAGLNFYFWQKSQAEFNWLQDTYLKEVRENAGYGPWYTSTSKLNTPNEDGEGYTVTYTYTTVSDVSADPDPSKVRGYFDTDEFGPIEKRFLSQAECFLWSDEHARANATTTCETVYFGDALEDVD